MAGFTGTLNPQQREAATHIHGPLLILAGAGTGKTRVITARIAHMVAMIHQGRIAAYGTPAEILASPAEEVRQFIRAGAV